MPSAVQNLRDSDPNMQVLGAAFIQHECYNDTDAKNEVLLIDIFSAFFFSEMEHILLKYGNRFLYSSDLKEPLLFISFHPVNLQVAQYLHNMWTLPCEPYRKYTVKV